MIVSHNQKIAQMLVHSPFLAVAGPFLRELIGFPSFSGLTANLPPQICPFCKKIAGVCIYLLDSPIPPTPKIAPGGQSPWPSRHKKRSIIHD